MGWVPAVVLDLLFIVLDLLFDPLRSKAECVMHIAILIDRDKLVFVFRVCEDFHGDLVPAFLALKIHRNHDGCETVEEVEQLLGLFLELFMGIVIQMPVPGGNCHLHRLTSCSVLSIQVVDALESLQRLWDYVN
jgi:hypothetical protein